jgi:DNA-binding Xre family transcriptional regulator
MRKPLKKQLAVFLRRRRASMTFVEFSRTVCLPISTLHRLEHGKQTIRLKLLEKILKRFRCSLSDIFPGW